MRFLLCLAFTLALTFTPPQTNAADDPESPVVAVLIEEIGKTSADFQAVDPHVIAARRTWLLRTVERLREFMADNPDDVRVSLWRQQLPLEEICAELSRRTPDAHQLKQIRDEEFVAYEWSVDTNYGDDQAVRGFHAVAAVGRALHRYAEALDDHQHGKEAKQRLKDRLATLTKYLNEYKELGTVEDQQERVSRRRIKIKDIHAVIGELEASEQVPYLTKEIREHYLQPKVRAFVSTRLLTHLVSVVPLGSQPVSQNQNRTRIQGRATPTGSLSIFGIEHDEIGILDAGYHGPIAVNLTVSRPHLKLGISARLNADIDKRIFAIHGAPDSASTDSDFRLLGASSSGGSLIDRFVDNAARRNFSGAQVSGPLNNQIDSVVTNAANFINVGVVQKLGAKLNEVAGNVTRVKNYRSRPCGLELTLVSASQGFRAPDKEGPPDFLEAAASDVDFAICVHRGVAQTLFPDKDQALTLKDLAAGLARALEPNETAADGDGSPRVWFPDENAFDFENGKINFRIADGDAPPKEYAGTVEFAYHYEGDEKEALVFETKVHVENNPMLQEKLDALLKRFDRLERIRLPDFSALSQSVKTLKIELSHPELIVEPLYVTLSGKLVPNP